MTIAPEQIFASPDRDDGWRWPRASKFPEQGPYENVSYTRSDLVDPAETLATLQKRVAELEGALTEILLGASPDHWVPQYQHCVDVARAALSGEAGE